MTPVLPPGAPPRPNVDATELAKFGALAHHWWDPDSAMFGPLHKINPLRVGWLDGVTGGLAGKRVVVVGIDLGEKAIGVAQLHQLESGSQVDYRLIAAEALAAEMPASFDVVACME